MGSRDRREGRRGKEGWRERVSRSSDPIRPGVVPVVRGRRKDPRRPRSALRRGRTKTHHGVALGRPQQGQRKHIAGAVEVSLPRRGAGLGFAPVTGSEECGHAVAPRDVRDLERETSQKASCGFSVALPLLSTTGGAPSLGVVQGRGGNFRTFYSEDFRSFLLRRTWDFYAEIFAHATLRRRRLPKKLLVEEQRAKRPQSRRVGKQPWLTDSR